MQPYSVLVVDDDGAQRRMFHRVFEEHGINARCAASGAEALELTAVTPLPLLILSDIDMPGMDGVTLLRRLRSQSTTASIPAILMTGLPLPAGLMEAAVESLGIGPVHIKGDRLSSLLARVMTTLNALPCAGGVVIDALNRTVTIEGHKLPVLPARRFQMLCALLRQPRAMSREELMEQVWDEQSNLNLVDVTILRLRQDLKSFPFLRIETVPAGYQLVIQH
jgi:DNA-binding response OmpR family regulator